MNIQTTDKHAYVRRIAYLLVQKSKGQLTPEEDCELGEWAGSNEYRQKVYEQMEKAIEILVDKKTMEVNKGFKWGKFFFLVLIIGFSGYIAGGFLLMVLCIVCFGLGILWKHDNDFL